MRSAGAVLRYWLPAVLLVAGCASTAPDVLTQRDPTANFAAYHTFAPPAPAGAGGTGSALPLVDSNIRTALADQMRLKRYTESTEKADLRIVYETTTAQRIESNPVQVGVGVGSWGSNAGGSVNVGSQSVRTYSEGTLVVHVIDNSRNAEVWEGRISTRLTKGSLDPSTVASTVAKVMRDFPAHPSSQ